MRIKKSELEALKEIKQFYARITFNGEEIGDARIVKIEAGGYTKGKLKLAYMPVIELKGDRFVKSTDCVDGGKNGN